MSKLGEGEKRLLLLDGHVSHFSRAFIERAIELDIIVLCYPPHATHLLQGLDVVLFSVAKAEWTKSRDKFERETGQSVTKETFLKVFGEAYTAAFTPANNKKAFEKTGVHPFNRSVINPNDLAPAIAHSVHAYLPLNVPSPVKAMIEIYRNTTDDLRRERDHANGWETDDEVVAIDKDGDSNCDDDGNDDGDNAGSEGECEGDADLSEPDSTGRGAGEVQRALLRAGPAPSAQKSQPSTPHPKGCRLSALPPRTPVCFQL